MKKRILTLLLIPVSYGLVFCSSNNSKAQYISNFETTNNVEIAQSQQQWRKMTEEEQNQEILSIINHKMGIAALNQIALEGFVGYDCDKSFYTNEYFGGMETLMRIQCYNPRGASVAIAYNEARIIFNRFEGNIEGFEIQRIGEEVNESTFYLPD